MTQASPANQTIVFLLLPTPQQKDHLRETVEKFNRACQYVSDMSESLNVLNKQGISPTVYRPLRDEMGLPSQMAVRAISKAIEARKHDTMSVSATKSWRRRETRVEEGNIPHTEIPLHSEVPYDQLMMSFPDVNTLSILCINGRENIPARYCYYADPNHEEGPVRGDLVYDSAQNVFFFHYHIPAVAREEAAAAPVVVVQTPTQRARNASRNVTLVSTNREEIRETATVLG